jgi:hypothetical protein
MSKPPINYSAKQAIELRKSAERRLLAGQPFGALLFANDAWELENGKTWLQFNRDENTRSKQ